MYQAIIILLLIIITLIFIIFIILKKYTIISVLNKDLISKKQSLSTRYGQITEQFIPFLSSYPYDEKRFRFIGNPIDGIQFEDDKIILLEFKSADSILNTRQKKIKQIVDDKKVYFEQISIK